MATRVLWYLKEHDGRFPWHPEGRFPVEHKRLIRTVQTIDQRGFYGLLSGTAPADSFITLSSLIGYTERVRFLVPIYPGIRSPRLLAQEALTFDKLSGGRLLLNLVNGQDRQIAEYGFFAPHDRRYEISREFWKLFVDFYEGRGGDYSNTYLDPRPGYDPGQALLKAGPILRDQLYGIPYGATQRTHPPLWGTGASPAGQTHAAEVVDVYLAFLREWDKVNAQTVSAIAVAAQHRRSYEHVGIHGSVIVRRTRSEARAAYYSQFEEIGPDRLAAHLDRQLRRATSGAAGLIDFTAPDEHRARVVDALRAGRLPAIEDLEIEPGLFLGLTEFPQVLDVTGNNFAYYLVGSGKEVATTLNR